MTNSQARRRKVRMERAQEEGTLSMDMSVKAGKLNLIVTDGHTHHTLMEIKNRKLSKFDEINEVLNLLNKKL